MRSPGPACRPARRVRPIRHQRSCPPASHGTAHGSAEHTRQGSPHAATTRALPGPPDLNEEPNPSHFAWSTQSSPVSHRALRVLSIGSGAGIAHQSSITEMPLPLPNGCRARFVASVGSWSARRATWSSISRASMSLALGPVSSGRGIATRRFSLPLVPDLCHEHTFSHGSGWMREGPHA